MPFWSRSQPPPSPAPPQESQGERLPEDAPTASKKLTREQQADAELAELLAALDSEHKSAAESKASSSRSVDDQDFDSAFPTEMNCMTAFDEMYYCYSLGGQFMNVYRYGGRRDCSEKSADWRFCMKTKVYGPVTRKAMILARYKQKAAKYKTGASSEDIWALRTEPLQHTFSGNLDDARADRLS